MIKKLKVVNSYGEELVMTLSEPQLSGYAITGINGLGPSEVDIKQTQLVSGRKYKYNSGFHKYREILINIIYYEYNDAYLNIDELRNRLYNYFKTGDRIKLYIEKDFTQYAIEGYVSKHDSLIFSDNCGASITVLCPDPWFRKNDVNFINMRTSISIENNGVYVNSATIPYEGNITSGFIVTIDNDIRDYLGETLTITSTHSLSGEERKFIINVPKNYKDDDMSIVNLYADLLSDFIKIYAKHENEETIKNCNGWIDATSISKRQELPELKYGDNVITVNTSSGLSLDFKIEYNTLYRGL